MLSVNRNHFVEGVPVRPTPNKSGVLNPRLLIVHDTAGALNSAGSISWLCNPQAKASAHFVVGRDGDITQLASCLVKTWHAGKSVYKGVNNVNDFAIGVEIVNPGKLSLAQNAKEARASFGASYSVASYNLTFAETAAHGKGWWMPYPQKQLDAVLSLSMAIRDRYGITLVAPHWEISPGRKIDTNPLFPLPWLRARMAGRQDDGVNDARLAAGAHVRKWPSFNDSNILWTTEEGTVVDILRSGTFTPTGDQVPVSKPSNVEPVLWYEIQAGTAKGWVIFSDLELL